MTFRELVSVTAVALLAACSGNSKKSAGGSSTPAKSDSSAGSVAAAGGGGGTTEKAKDPLPANHMGRIPVLEYHVIKNAPNALYTRNIDSFKADLEDVYKRGYRPITIAQMLDKNFSDVPDGMSPVVFVFDDASPEQFSYIEGPNGQLTIDPNSGVGIWEDFMKSHPGWKNHATFCVLNGASAGHNMFGDNPKYNGQKKEWRFQKLKWLADNGFELCDHTVWHMKLSQYPDDKVQQQIAANMVAIDSAVPGYKVRTMALPYGLWPKNKQLAWQGTWTDPKTGQAHPYHFDAVLEVSGGPTLSPYDPKFDPHHITRIEAIGNDIHNVLDKLDKTKTRFVK
jgi:peptidoglycan/xylan/chitin deacetylase (PgdA/CDA1 family)